MERPKRRDSSVTDIQCIENYKKSILKNLKYISNSLKQQKCIASTRANEFKRRHWICMSDIQQVHKYFKLRFIIAIIINSLVFLSALVVVRPDIPDDTLLSLFFIFISLSSVAITPIFTFYFYRRIQKIDEAAQNLVKDFNEFKL